MLVRAASFAALFALVACGGAANAPPPAPSEAVAAPAKPGASGKSLADLKAEFVASCQARAPGAVAYCECGWDQMLATFSEAEMNAPTEDPAKLATLKQRVETTCRRALPEATLKAAFVHGCAGDKEGRTPYCECTWGELRAHFSAADLAESTVLAADASLPARRSATRTCAPRLPEELAHERWLEGCLKEESMRAYCGCAWKVMRIDSSPAEIEGGYVDLEAVRPHIERSCTKFMPKKP